MNDVNLSNLSRRRSTAAAGLGAATEAFAPGIKIDTDAMARMTQLVQEGFVKISE
jgi:hypothetical protein